MKLKLLCLNWQEATQTVDKYTLHMICKLGGLEKFHLNNGTQHSIRCNWKIDHDLMLRCPARLLVLRKIVFSQDLYESHTDGFEEHYERRIPNLHSNMLMGLSEKGQRGSVGTSVPDADYGLKLKST
jgi:hypothetical protein